MKIQELYCYFLIKSTRIKQMCNNVQPNNNNNIHYLFGDLVLSNLRAWHGNGTVRDVSCYRYIDLHVPVSNFLRRTHSSDIGR